MCCKTLKINKQPERILTMSLFLDGENASKVSHYFPGELQIKFLRFHVKYSKTTANIKRCLTGAQRRKQSEQTCYDSKFLDNRFSKRLWHILRLLQDHIL